MFHFVVETRPLTIDAPASPTDCYQLITCKMAKATGRRWLGVDVSSEYTSIAKRRLREVKAESIPSLESRADPLDDPIAEDESVAMRRWCEREIPAARTEATGGRAVTCSSECSRFNSRQRRNELKAEGRAKEKARQDESS